MTFRIYTRTGDDGTTALFGGTRLRKDAVRIEAYGTVDELNSVIGLARSGCMHASLSEWLDRIQHHLFTLGADLATPLDAASVSVPRVDASMVTQLEEGIDTLEEALPPITFFILPGGSETAARLHLARTVCRRAERLTVALAGLEQVNEHDIHYLNRLSDFLFVLARTANQLDGAGELRWMQERGG